ncbi:hypothetical protein AGMMS50267_04640 [Spirochaetia bacterium]|nr:hypothetical protein AGMMS50267_04640 [Spirochaetia bacterium]
MPPPRSFGLKLTALIVFIAALAFTGCAKTTDGPDAPALDITAPAEIAGLTAAAGDGRVILTWTDPKDKDFEYVEITFTPKKDGVDQPIEAEAGDETATIRGLTNETTYTFIIKTVDSIGNMSKGKKKTVTLEAASGGPDTTAPAEVSGLTTTAGDGQVVLRWTDPVDSDFDRVEITYTNGPSRLLVPKAGQLCTISGLSNGTAYMFTVKTVDISGNSSAGTIVAAVPTPGPDTTAPAEVSDLTATAGSGSVVLDWTNPADGDFAKAEITFSPVVDGVTQPVTVFMETATISGLSNGTAYTFTVKTVDTTGNRSAGTTVAATPALDTTAPAEVSGLTATAERGYVVLDWTDPADGDFVGVEITFSSMAGGVTQPVPVLAGTATATISGLSNGTAYTFTVKTVDITGNRSAGSTVAATPVLDTTAPAEVSGLTATAGNRSVVLDWTNPTDGDFAGVEIIFSPTAGGVTQSVPVLAGTATATISGLSNGTAYTFLVKTKDTTGNSSTGTTATANPIAPDTTAPAAVSGLTAVAGDGSVAFTWTDPADGDFAGVEITFYPAVDGVTQPIPVTPGTQNRTISGLTNGTLYTFTVKTKDTTGNKSAGTIKIVTPTNAAATYSISLSQTGAHIFPAAFVGYAAGGVTPRAVKGVTITNTGNRETGALTVSLSGPGIASFTATSTTATSTIASIAVGGTGQLEVRRNPGLGIGTHTATVTVRGENGITANFDVSFTVNSTSMAPVYGIGLTQTGTYTFPARGAGYGFQASLTVTIANTGNQPTGALTVSRSGPGSGSFSASSTINSIAVGGTDTFNVTPIIALAAGTHTATVTVDGSNGITASFEVSFTVSAYGIRLDQTGDYTFPAATGGYTAQTPKTITITNRGSQATGALAVFLSGRDAGSFSLSATTISSIAVGGISTFNVTPNIGLEARTHTATVTVSGDNGITANFQVQFTVNPVPTYGISLNPAGTYTFPAAVVGYGAQIEKPVTITNTGNQATGDLTVSLSGPGSGSFTLSSPSVGSIGTIIGFNNPRQFGVRPNTGLTAGTHTATVTVRGGNGITASVDVSFTVYPAGTVLVYRIGLSQTGLHTFPPATAGYGVQAPLSVTITNTGNEPTGGLSILIDGINYGGELNHAIFPVSPTSIAGIAVGGTATFTVAPKTGLAAGTYTAPVAVDGRNGISEGFTVSFTVN